MPYVERITNTGETVKKDRYFTPELKKIHRSRTMKKIHVEVIITNAEGNREILQKLKKTLVKIKRLFPISYAIIEVDFQE